MNIEIKEVCWKHAEAMCNARLIELGYETFIPYNTSEIDLIAHKEGELRRIQIKSISPTNLNRIEVDLYRSVINFKKHSYEPYKYIDWFLIYDGTNIFKIDRDSVNTSITLRYTKPKNNQVKGIRMAKDYLF